VHDEQQRTEKRKGEEGMQAVYFRGLRDVPEGFRQCKEKGEREESEEGEYPVFLLQDRTGEHKEQEGKQSDGKVGGDHREEVDATGNGSRRCMNGEEMGEIYIEGMARWVRDPE
jgi:hypothetical protein